MIEFVKKHKLWFIIGGGVIALYFIYEWYQSVQAANASNSDAANQAAAQEGYLNDLLYGQPTDLGSGASTPAGSGTATSGINPVSTSTSSTPTTPAGGTSTTNPSASSSSSTSGAPAGTTVPTTSTNGAAPIVNLSPTPTQAQISALGGNLAFNPTNSEAQDFAAEGYTGNTAQDAANARSLAGVGTPYSTSLFLGNPQEISGSGGTGAPPELVAACNADMAAGQICGQPGSQSDMLAFQLGLPTEGNYETGPNGSVIQISPGVTPIGLTPEEIANEAGNVYTAPNGVTFVNGQPVTGATLPTPGPGSPISNKNPSLTNAGPSIPGTFGTPPPSQGGQANQTGVPNIGAPLPNQNAGPFEGSDPTPVPPTGSTQLPNPFIPGPNVPIAPIGPAPVTPPFGTPTEPGTNPNAPSASPSLQYTRTVVRGNNLLPYIPLGSNL
jgi:hypothetical protein